MNISDQDFKDCVSKFSAGIAVASTLDFDGEPVGISISSFTSVSLNPKLILFCMDKKASVKEYFIRADSFAISILGSEQYLIAKHFSDKSNNNWEGVKYVKGCTGVPIIVPCLSFIECEKFSMYEAGDHFIIIGKVINLKIVEDNPKANPLISFCGNYYHNPEMVP